MKFSFQNICFLKWILPFLSLLVWRLFCFFFFFRFLVSFYFLFYFGAVWVSSANERMLCMLVHNYQRRKSRGVFILIFMGNSLIFCMQKMGTVNKKPKRIKERKRNTKKGRKKKSFCYFIALSKKILSLLSQHFMAEYFEEKTTFFLSTLYLFSSKVCQWH